MTCQEDMSMRSKLVSTIIVLFFLVNINTVDQAQAFPEKFIPSDQNNKGEIAYTSSSHVYLPIIRSGPTVGPKIGIWITREELAKLPTSGPAWDNLKEVADEAAGVPDLSDSDDNANIRVLAKALVFARTGENNYYFDVHSALKTITYNDTEQGGDALALGRELAAYVISADLINLAENDSGLDVQFKNKLRILLTKELDERSLQSTHEARPNNWGTHAGASRAAVSVYLGDSDEIERTARVFQGYLGDISVYDGFKFGDDLSWQCDPLHPVGINPKGCIKDGHLLDGSLPDEMRRGGSFQWPPNETYYPWEGLQGAVVQAEILSRAGYASWQRSDNALLRAVEFLYGIGWAVQGDDEWQIWLINKAYGKNFPAESPARWGKNMGWTDWTHSTIGD